METSRIQLLSRYAIERELGGGAMGKVYLARDRLIDRQVVLKTLFSGESGNGEVALDARERARLLEEARAAGRITHPNVVTVYDLLDDIDTDRLFLALEFVDGEPLSTVLRRMGRLPLRRALEIAIQVAAGLEHLHGAGIIHRDIKPANILLDSKGRVKITDFGIARAAGGPHREEDGSVFGTPPYMAPEQLTDTPVDARADVFSLGAVLYEMLAGTRAFQGKTVTEMARNTLQGDTQPLIEAAPDTPIEVSAVVSRALHRDPASRYQSAAAMVQELRRAQRALPAAGSTHVDAAVRDSEVVGRGAAQGGEGATELMLRTRWRRWLRGERSPWTPSERRRLRAVVLGLALSAVVGLAGGWWLFDRLEGARRAAQQADQNDRLRVFEQQLLAEGTRLLDDGEASAALAIFSLAERLTPASARAEQLRMEAETVVTNDRSSVVDNAEAASVATRILEAPEPSEAIENARQALDPKNRGRLEGVLGDLESALGPPVPEGKSRVDIELRSDVPKGRLVVYRGPEQVANEGFSFFKRKGLFHRERIEGSLHFQVDVNPGRADLRVMVVPRGEGGRVVVTPANLRRGETKRLLVQQPENGDPRVTWG